MPGNAVLDHRLQNHWHANDERYVRRAEQAAVDALSRSQLRSFVCGARTNSIGRAAWEERYAYSLRWMIEYVFLAVKRTLGGDVRSRRRDLMFSEVENKFWTWSEMRRTDLCN